MKNKNLIFSGFVAVLAMVVSLHFVNAQRFQIVGSTKPVTLDWLLEEGDLWSKTADDLEKEMGSSNFVWQEKERTRARFDPDKRNLTLNGVKVGETLVTLKEGKISGVTISYINKGDDGRVDRGAYNDTVAKVKEAIEKGGGSSMKEEPRPRNEQVTKASASLWRGEKALYLLEHLFLEEEEFTEDGWIWTVYAHAEFVRLRLLPPIDRVGMGVEKFNTTVSRPQLASLVKREGRKAVIEGVPMVNQGSKGYCAVATLERVIRYYGADIDMHDLANLANTYGGTDPHEMKRTVRQISQKLRMNAKFPLFVQSRDIESMAKAYNREAKKAGRNDADPRRGFFLEADNQLLKKMRVESRDYERFKREVVDSINRGIPVLWALHLGFFWEDQIEGSYEANRYAVNKPDAAEAADKDLAELIKKMDEERKAEMEQMRKEMPRPPEYMQGGHMRLIVGYDGEEGTIFYTDSWGPGHEMKKMSIEEAFAATYAIMAIEPR